MSVRDGRPSSSPLRVPNERGATRGSTEVAVLMQMAKSGSLEGHGIKGQRGSQASRWKAIAAHLMYGPVRTASSCSTFMLTSICRNACFASRRASDGDVPKRVRAENGESVGKRTISASVSHV